jgi:hypothetical protein
MVVVVARKDLWKKGYSPISIFKIPYGDKPNSEYTKREKLH